MTAPIRERRGSGKYDDERERDAAHCEAQPEHHHDERIGKLRLGNVLHDAGDCVSVDLGLLHGGARHRRGLRSDVGSRCSDAVDVLQDRPPRSEIVPRAVSAALAVPHDRNPDALHGAEALGRLDSAEGGLPGRLTPTEDFRAVGPASRESEGGEDRPGESGGEARSARGRSPLSREGAPAAAGRGARACELSSPAGAAGRAPGASNTRRRKQPDARGVPAKYDAAQPPAPAAPPPKFLQCRVDALRLRFRGGLAKAQRNAFETALAMAKDLGLSTVAVSVGPHTMALSAKSREGWWSLKNDEVQVTFDASGSLKGWGLEVKLRAMALADRGAGACADLAGDIATHMLDFVEGERVGWIDLCADFVSFDIATIAPRQWVASGRAKTREITPGPHDCMTQHFDAGTRETITIGKTDIQLRVYDKSGELVVKDPSGVKRAAEHARWRDAGWNGTEGVVRVEFQVRGSALDEVDGGQLRDTSRFIQRLDALWSYLTRKWIRLCVLDSASRRTNWADDYRWQAVKAVSFGTDDGEIATRTRRRGAPDLKVVAGYLLSYAAKSGILDDAQFPSATEVAKWGPVTARAFVGSVLAALTTAVGDRLAHDMLSSDGPIRAAMRLAERLSAIRATGWSDLTAETRPCCAFFEMSSAAE